MPILQEYLNIEISDSKLESMYRQYSRKEGALTYPNFQKIWLKVARLPVHKNYPPPAPVIGAHHSYLRGSRLSTAAKNLTSEAR
jgi:hypothetical protein